jgi:hypothetical protein
MAQNLWDFFKNIHKHMVYLFIKMMENQYNIMVVFQIIIGRQMN